MDQIRPPTIQSIAHSIARTQANLSHENLSLSSTKTWGINIQPTMIPWSTAQRTAYETNTKNTTSVYFNSTIISHLKHRPTFSILYKVNLRAMYARPHYIFFDKIHNPCDDITTYVTPTHLADKGTFLLEHIIPTIDNIINPHII